jgi:hypothetical protein
VWIGAELRGGLGDGATPSRDCEASQLFPAAKAAQCVGQRMREIGWGIGVQTEMGIGLLEELTPEGSELLGPMRPGGADQEGAAAGLLKLGELRVEHAMQGAEHDSGLVEGPGSGKDLKARHAQTTTLAKGGAGQRFREPVAGREARSMAGASSVSERDAMLAGASSYGLCRGTDLRSDVGKRSVAVYVLEPQPIGIDAMAAVAVTRRDRDPFAAEALGDGLSVDPVLGG